MSDFKTIIGPPGSGNLRVARMNGELWFANVDVCRILKRSTVKPYDNPTEHFRTCRMKLPTKSGSQTLIALDEATVRLLTGKLKASRPKETATLEVMLRAAADAFRVPETSDAAPISPPPKSCATPPDSMLRIIRECAKLGQHDRDKVYTFILGYKAGMAGRDEVKEEEDDV